MSENLMLKILNGDAEKLGGKVTIEKRPPGFEQYVLYDENGDEIMYSNLAEAIGQRLQISKSFGIPLSARREKR